MHRQGGFAIDLRDVARDLRVDIDRGERSRIDGLRGRIRLEADRTNLDIDAPWLDSDSRIEIDRGHVELSVPKGQQLTVRTDISCRGRFHGLSDSVDVSRAASVRRTYQRRRRRARCGIGPRDR